MNQVIIMSDEAADVAEFTGSVGEASSTNRRAEASQKALPRRGKSTDPNSGDFICWGVYGNGKYVSARRTIESLPIGIYKQDFDDAENLILTKVRIVTDKIFTLADTVSENILQSIENFWNARERFQKYGMLFKRGVMLFGPAGSGKTYTLQIICDKIIERGGIIVLCDNPKVTNKALKMIRQIEPDRPILNIMEDLDTLVERFGEQDILPMLDGEDQIDNIIHIATTNYPERLDTRLVNRPSRFDEIRKVGMPAANVRKAYMLSVLEGRDTIDEAELEKWVFDTEGMSLAHLRELVVSVMCLQRDYASTIERLKSMKTKQPKSSNFGGSKGFMAND